MIGTAKPMSHSAVPPPGTPGHHVGRRLLEDAGHDPDDHRSDRQDPGQRHEEQADELVLDERSRWRVLEDAPDAGRDGGEHAEGAPRQECRR